MSCLQAFNVSVKASQSSSFIGGLGRLLDKGINRLISGDLPASGPASTGSDTDPVGRQIGWNPESGSPMVSLLQDSLHSNYSVMDARFECACTCSPQAHRALPQTQNALVSSLVRFFLIYQTCRLPANLTTQCRCLLKVHIPFAHQ